MNRDRAHTPIVSEAQRVLFGAVAGGHLTKASGLTQVEAKQHLHEAAGKDLPVTADKVMPWQDLLESQKVGRV